MIPIIGGQREVKFPETGVRIVFVMDSEEGNGELEFHLEKIEKCWRWMV